MPMIDVHAAAGTFADKYQLAVDLATAVMTVERVPRPDRRTEQEPARLITEAGTPAPRAPDHSERHR